VEAGFRSVWDWPAADQPLWLCSRAGPLLAWPDDAEVNDSSSIIHRRNTAQQFADMIVDQFDEMIAQSIAHPLVMIVSLHPFVVGQPFRLPALRRALTHCTQHVSRDQVWWTRPGEIADYCYDLPLGVIPDGRSAPK
jgi:hypothetical protein